MVGLTKNCQHREGTDMDKESPETNPTPPASAIAGAGSDATATAPATPDAKTILMRPETEETLEQLQLRAFQALVCMAWRSPCGRQDTCPRAAVNETCMRRRISSHGQRPLSARREDPTPIGCGYRTATSSGGDGCGVPINPAPTSHTTCGFDPAASRHHACGHGPPTEDTSCVSRW